MRVKYNRVSTQIQSGNRFEADTDNYDITLLDKISGTVPFKERPQAKILINKIEEGIIKEVPSVKEIVDWLDKQVPFTCFYTGEKLEREFGVDHIVSLTRGGSFRLDNLCITNPFINGAKGSMTGDEFKALLELISTWEDGGKEVLRRLRSAGTMFGGKK